MGSIGERPVYMFEKLYIGWVLLKQTDQFSGSLYRLKAGKRPAQYSYFV